MDMSKAVGVNFQAGFQASASLSGGVLTRTSPSIEWGGFGADSPSMSGGVLDKVHWKSKRPHSIEGEGFVRCGRKINKVSDLKSGTRFCS